MANNEASGTKHKELFALYKHMVTARKIDLLEQSYTSRGEAFFHVSGWGHEATAMLAPFLKKEDYLHCHYRDKALMLAHGMESSMFFSCLFNKDNSHSRGRQMNAHMSAPELHILSLVGPVGNSALQAAGVAAQIKNQKEKPFVLCALGDGMSQQGEVLEGIAQAVRDSLPVLFLIEDNQFAISTKTDGRTFYDRPNGEAEEYYGIPITRINGRNPVETYESFKAEVAKIRETRKPSIVVFEVDRLDSHTNADDQRVYRSKEEIEAVREKSDPVKKLRNYLTESGVNTSEIESLEVEIQNRLEQEARSCQRSTEPEPMHTAVQALPETLSRNASEYRGAPEKLENTVTMIEAIREVLREKLTTDKRVSLFGEDIEDPKGDVFGVTRGLKEQFPGRIENSPLSEASIVGVTIGRALAGGRPVAFLQFADFLPLAYNQVFAELGSMYWRTDGGWKAPVILMITCGGYKPGLGPFHASSMEGLAAHTPGIDVFMPSTAGDAAGLLNAAFKSERPTLFFYPKNCLNQKAGVTSPDISKHLVPPGRARVIREGRDITLLGWGNTVALCMQAAEALSEADIEAEVIDLRSMVPWDKDLIASSANKTGRLIVAHEDNHTAGMGAEIIATVAERTNSGVAAKRVTRGDTYVPCNFANQLEVLPSYKRILEAAVSLFEGTIEWEKPIEAGAGESLVEAIGASPSDESVTIIEWKVEKGAEISEGDLLADLEADKAAIELLSPFNGTVTEFLEEEGNTVSVGTPILKLKTGEDADIIKPVTREEPGTPQITIPSKESNAVDGNTVKTAIPQLASGTEKNNEENIPVAGIVDVTAYSGSRTVDNEELSQMCPSWSPADIVKRTGIESRQWITEDEDALSLSVLAAKQLFEKTGYGIKDIDCIIVSTGTPIHTTPSLAAMVQAELGKDVEDVTCQCYDINAACSGYVYALQNAHDYLFQEPDAKILIVTADILSPRLDTADPATAPIFGDAATASLVVGRDNADRIKAEIHRPVLSTEGEDGNILRIPADLEKPIYMDGVKVFQKAVASMIGSLKSALNQSNLSVEDLDLIVPHQANQRIINAIRQRLKLDKAMVYSNISHFGNTSSSTIPLCLNQLLPEKPGLYGLTAFGGGFTFGGGVLKVRP